MRLLIHGINYAPECVGIGRYTGNMGAWLARRGHQVTVLCAPPYYPDWRVPPAYQGLSWRRELLEGVEVLRAPLYVPARVTGKSRLLHELSFAASCLRWWPHLWRRRWDAILAVCPLTQSGIIPALLSRAQKIPFLFHFQDLQVDMARELGLLKPPTLLALAEKVEAWILKNARLVTTISEGMAARLRVKGVPPTRLHLLPNWADLDNIRPGSRNNPLRRELGLNPENLVILYAGSLGEKQGLEIILECAHLTRNEPNIVYIITGEGGARERLITETRQQGLDKVTFLPIQSDARFPLLLAMGDIHLVVQKARAADLVMPSKLTNILAAGRPFIATAAPGTELARATIASQAGLLVPPEDAPALIQAIHTLAASPATREKMGQKSRRYAESQLGQDHILSQMEALLNEVCQASPMPQ
ncbi:MAG: WcaI family glycosyltransferase [Desulfobaccales bacterium]